jgi:hypothetical protein
MRCTIGDQLQSRRQQADGCGERRGLTVANRLAVVLAVQLVGAVDEMNLHGFITMRTSQ